MKLLLAALVPFCLSVRLVRSNGNGTSVVSPHPTISKINVTTTPENTTASTIHTSTYNVTAEASTTKNNLSIINMTSTKPTSVKTSHTTEAAPKTVVPTAAGTAAQASVSGFSAGSFLGGIVLTLGLLAIGYVGCKTYHTKRGVQYRTIDEHDAII